ncbi:unnamed protein product [Rotaria sp. Silwood2]|nr:unnamed protein product [Rotaria sp. Silwood2]CAF4278902.1 unnamed protein product [Rotaria sp. Silwood2]
MENINQTIDQQHIGSIYLSSQCQITCSNPNSRSPYILIQSNNNLQTTTTTITTITSSSRHLRSPPWSYRYIPNQQRSTLT